MEDPDPHLYELFILATTFLKGFSFSLLPGLISIIVLLFLSGLISGSEIAYFSLGPSEINRIKQRKGSVSLLILKHLERPKKLLATILIANNFVNVAIIILSAYITGKVFDFSGFPVWGFIIQVVVITSLILLIGEIMPKILATARPVTFAFFMARPIQIMSTLVAPLGSLLIRSTSFMDGHIIKKGMNISMSELSEAIDITSNDSTPEDEKKLLKGILKFYNIETKEIMKPRIDVTAVDSVADFTELLDIIMESGFSRIPVYESDFDHIKGILYIKDLLPHLTKGSDFSWQDLVRPAFFVPENKQINDLLGEFQEKKIHMAIIVDEYGGTSGIITLEDIIEEIVGEISDEFDVEEDEIQHTRIDDNTFVFEGKTPLNDFYRIMGIEEEIFEDEKGDADTLAGLILEKEGEFPDKNTEVIYGAFKFKILDVDNRRISRIKVSRNPEEND